MSSKTMEVEVKIRLPDKSAFDKLTQLLAPGKKASHAQENYFFDGSNRELEATRSVLRVRFYNNNDKAVITVKGKQILQNGIGRASEVEEDVKDVQAARTWLTTPDLLLQASPLLQQLNEKIGMKHLVCLGGFKNQREVFEWEGQTLELDETQYEWGTLYEIECETTEPEVVRDKLEALLSTNGVSYSYSVTSKFANFINKSLL